VPKSAAEIVRILDVNETGEDCFLGGHPDESLLEKVYGGQLIGQALASAARTVDPARPAHSLQATCLDPGRHGAPIRYEVERIRDGRSFSSRSVRAFQGDRQVLRLIASFQPDEPGLAHQVTMPPVANPEDALHLYDVMRTSSSMSHDEWRTEWTGLDIRYTREDPLASTGCVPGVQQLWVRVRDRLPDDPALHRNTLAYLSDLTLLSTSLLPHGILLGSPDLPRATLNHSVWFHGEARADEWLFVDQRSPWAGGARGLSFASVYTADGRHVASLAQEGLIRPLREARRYFGLD
jgi:acyl-CoA thioesterase-2